jgi:branched-chain amino acid transport system substrate-binding protein
MCTGAWTNPKTGGVPASIDPLIECTVATQDLSAYPGGKDFLKAYKAKYGNANPDPYSIYGYAAMQLALHAISAAGAGGDNKADVVKSLFATKDYKSVLGTFSINSDGDTTIKTYGLYKVGSNGDPVFDKTLAPTKTVH